MPEEKIEPAAKVETKEETKPESYTLKVDGQDRTVTLAEMQELATKSAGADAKFQDAATMRKEAEKGLRISTLISDLSENPSEASAKELAVHLGIDPGEFMQFLGKEDTPPADKGKAKLSKADIVEALGYDPAEDHAIAEHSKTRHIEAAKQELRRISDEAVDKDGVFGKMIIGEKRDDRLSVLKDEVAEDVLRKIQDGERYGAEMVAASVQKIRAKYTKFGIPGNPAIDPIVLGLGPGGVLPTAIQSDEPISRKSAVDDPGADNLVARYMQKGLQALRQKRQ